MLRGTSAFSIASTPAGRPVPLLAQLLLLWVTAMFATHAMAQGGAVRRPINSNMFVVMAADGTIHVEAKPERGEGARQFARRLCGSSSKQSELERANGGGRLRLRLDTAYRVPFECLRQPHREAAIRALLPQDRSDPRGWIHRVGSLPGVDNLWMIAEWFTGSGESFRALRESNGLLDEELAQGQELLIPVGILRQELRTGVLAAARRSARLEYGEDAQGSYALYRLQAGEALYSSVVVRFTGEVFASEVNRLAARISERSGIRDVTDIPIGYAVKVPLDILLPEHLPEGHERRVAWEQDRVEAGRFTNSVRARDLQGVTVVLDAGHGGQDVGAAMDGVWESLYVYDIMLRVRQILLEETAATVLTTTRDGSSYKISDRDVLPASRGHSVLTSPPYRIAQGRVGTNLRYYLANSMLQKAVVRDGDADKVVFLSIHADSLHPSIRGAMVYVPGVVGGASNHGKSGPPYSSIQEVKDQPRVTISNSARAKHKGLSLDLAQHVITGFRSRGLEIHPNQPVRDRIVRRRGRPWVPAVLRYNHIPSKILLEVCNLANPQDRRLVQTRAFRQAVAEATVDGILAYYGYPPYGPRGSQTLVSGAGAGGGP